MYDSSLPSVILKSIESKFVSSKFVEMLQVISSLINFSQEKN